jgi:hypothetical protein
MFVALRAELILSLMATIEVLREEPSLLIMSLCFLRLGPFLVKGPLVVGWGEAAAVAGLADSGVFYFIDFFATCALVVRAGWVVLLFG